MLEGRFIVRSVVALILMGTILVCPFICGLDECACATNRHHVDGPNDGPSPGHCPEDGDDCICRGAIPSSDVKIPHADDSGLRLSLYDLTGILAHTTPHSLAHLTNDGHPAGLASCGGAVVVRALLQNFRC